MADKEAPRPAADPWTDSVDQQERKGKRREIDEKRKLQGEKNARRRDDKEQKAEKKQGRTG